MTNTGSQLKSSNQTVGLITGAALLYLLLIVPNHPIAPELLTIWMAPLELPVILLGLLLLPATSALGKLTHLGLVIALILVTVFKLADFATYLAFNRPFNLVIDWNLVIAGWHTLAESIGYGLALVTLLGTLIAIGLLAWVLWLATGLWLKLQPSPRLAKLSVAGLLISTTMAGAHAGHVAGHWQFANPPPGDTSTMRVAWRYVHEPVATLRSLREFENLADGATPLHDTGLLQKLKGYDVVLIYVESYGRSSFDNPMYAATHTTTLQQAQQQLSAQGLAMRSGWLTAPMVGGQSWLTHSTMASGLWVSDQGRYRALIKSGRSTLFDDAKAAGFRTVAIMPAIRLAWPEGDYFGFDAIYPSDALGYGGLPFNWVTMPDQFALAALDRLERNRQTNPKPNLFVQVALSSSHAPFTPIPKLLPWDALGDGSVFNTMGQAGDSPQTIWSDTDRVREQFKLAVDYSLQTVFDYIAHHTQNNLQRRQLIIVLGDHEPARFISGVDGQDVAMHVIGPPELLSEIDTWDLTAGLIPAVNLPAWRMDEFRTRFVEAFSVGNP
ncbi:hypothetical protein [Orrella daihaiensis]|uniref:Sulfatase n=1 Tax=Orrella daihaiensis TaxID=2782176 RepID=A0ABY4AMP3_9BURK|nr:hypothetical protein [Orrella daihaiensis]UOD51308.1 sulfatase [Orrella daihaiensis]